MERSRIKCRFSDNLAVLQMYETTSLKGMKRKKGTDLSNFGNE
jgi:hypothetical protein